MLYPAGVGRVLQLSRAAEVLDSMRRLDTHHAHMLLSVSPKSWCPTWWSLSNGRRRFMAHEWIADWEKFIGLHFGYGVEWGNDQQE